MKQRTYRAEAITLQVTTSTRQLRRRSPPLASGLHHLLHLEHEVDGAGRIHAVCLVPLDLASPAIAGPSTLDDLAGPILLRAALTDAAAMDAAHDLVPVPIAVAAVVRVTSLRAALLVASRNVSIV